MYICINTNIFFFLYIFCASVIAHLCVCFKCMNPIAPHDSF